MHSSDEKHDVDYYEDDLSISKTILSLVNANEMPTIEQMQTFLLEEFSTLDNDDFNLFQSILQDLLIMQLWNPPLDCKEETLLAQIDGILRKPILVDLTSQDDAPKSDLAAATKGLSFDKLAKETTTITSSNPSNNAKKYKSTKKKGDDKRTTTNAISTPTPTPKESTPKTSSSTKHIQNPLNYTTTNSQGTKRQGGSERAIYTLIHPSINLPRNLYNFYLFRSLHS